MCGSGGGTDRRGPVTPKFGSLVLLGAKAGTGSAGGVWSWPIAWFSIQNLCVDRPSVRAHTIGFRVDAIPPSTTDGPNTCLSAPGTASVLPRPRPRPGPLPLSLLLPLELAFPLRHVVMPSFVTGRVMVICDECDQDVNVSVNRPPVARCCFRRIPDLELDENSSSGT